MTLLRLETVNTGDSPAFLADEARILPQNKSAPAARPQAHR
jgi:hypothetical protein